MTLKRKRLLAAVIVPIQVALSMLAWRDLGRRSDAQIRGKKNLWRVIVTINPGNALAYWLFARR